MSFFLTIVIVLSAIFIVLAVVMQPSKDGGLSGLSSGGVTDSVFGTGRNEFLTKTTWWLLTIFLVSCLVLAKTKTSEHKNKEAQINTRSKLETVEKAELPKTDTVKPVIPPVGTEIKVDDKATLTPPVSAPVTNP